MRRGFTMLELILAVMLLSIMTVVSIATYRAVTTGWRVSREYVDKLERTDYALDQLVSGLKCAYYPHGGEQSYDYGFVLTNGGDGDDPDDSDTIEWTKKGPALIGGSSTADAVHRIQVKILEEGDTWGENREKIEKTGLYARVKPLAKVIAEETSHKGNEDEEFSFANEELYRPVLIAKDVVGFNCRVQPKEPEEGEKGQKENKDSFEDEFDASNAVPYKVQLVLYVLKEDEEYASKKQRVPILRVIKMPVYEQSQDGSTLPGKEKTSSKTSGGKSSTKSTGGGKARK